MSVKERARHIGAELKGHLPFTLLGALLGIFFMLIFRRVSGIGGRGLFMVFHPAHVVLSAMVTASMFKIHAARKHFILVLLVGYFGSIGIATLSDIVIPHIGTQVFGLDVPTHTQVHSGHTEEDSHQDAAALHDEHENDIHLAFIKEWYLVNPAALVGILIAFFLPRTKFPHAGHVLVSTWASSSYLLMSMASAMTLGAGIEVFVTLLAAVWLPCCISDIVFPLLFVKSDLEVAAACPHHGLHSHPHIQAEPEAEA